MNSESHRKSPSIQSIKVAEDRGDRTSGWIMHSISSWVKRSMAERWESHLAGLVVSVIVLAFRTGVVAVLAIPAHPVPETIVLFLVVAKLPRAKTIAFVFLILLLALHVETFHSC